MNIRAMQRFTGLLLTLLAAQSFAAEAPQSSITPQMLQVDGNPVQNLGTILANPLDQLAVRTEAGADLDSIKKLVEEQGGILDKLVNLPDDAGGGSILGIKHDSEVADQLQSTLQSASGVQYVEYIWCRKFLPDGGLAMLSNPAMAPMVGSIAGLPTEC